MTEDARDFRLMLAWIAAAIFLSMAVGFAFLIEPAHAHWDPRYASADPAVASWYSSQHNASGEFCCDKSDGHDFYDAYVIDNDGSVEFDADGQHFHLAKDKVLTGPNPTGHAVWWFVANVDGSIRSYCFAIGPQG